MVTQRATAGDVSARVKTSVSLSPSAKPKKKAAGGKSAAATDGTADDLLCQDPVRCSAVVSALCAYSLASLESRSIELFLTDDECVPDPESDALITLRQVVHAVVSRGDRTNWVFRGCWAEDCIRQLATPSFPPAQLDLWSARAVPCLSDENVWGSTTESKKHIGQPTGQTAGQLTGQESPPEQFSGQNAGLSVAPCVSRFLSARGGGPFLNFFDQFDPESPGGDTEPCDQPSRSLSPPLQTDWADVVWYTERHRPLLACWALVNTWRRVVPTDQSPCLPTVCLSAVTAVLSIIAVSCHPCELVYALILRKSTKTWNLGVFSKSLLSDVRRTGFLYSGQHTIRVGPFLLNSRFESGSMGRASYSAAAQTVSVECLPEKGGNRMWFCFEIARACPSAPTTVTIAITDLSRSVTLYQPKSGECHRPVISVRGKPFKRIETTPCLQPMPGDSERALLAFPIYFDGGPRATVAFTFPYTQAHLLHSLLSLCSRSLNVPNFVTPRAPLSPSKSRLLDPPTRLPHVSLNLLAVTPDGHQTPSLYITSEVDPPPSSAVLPPSSDAAPPKIPPAPSPKSAPSPVCVRPKTPVGGGPCAQKEPTSADDAARPKIPPARSPKSSSSPKAVPPAVCVRPKTPVGSGPCAQKDPGEDAGLAGTVPAEDPAADETDHRRPVPLRLDAAAADPSGSPRSTAAALHPAASPGTRGLATAAAPPATPPPAPQQHGRALSELMALPPPTPPGCPKKPRGGADGRTPRPATTPGHDAARRTSAPGTSRAPTASHADLPPSSGAGPLLSPWHSMRTKSAGRAPPLPSRRHVWAPDPVVPGPVAQRNGTLYPIPYGTRTRSTPAAKSAERLGQLAAQASCRSLKPLPIDPGGVRPHSRLLSLSSVLPGDAPAVRGGGPGSKVVRGIGLNSSGTSAGRRTDAWGPEPEKQAPAKAPADEAVGSLARQPGSDETQGDPTQHPASSDAHCSEEGPNTSAYPTGIDRASSLSSEGSGERAPSPVCTQLGKTSASTSHQTLARGSATTNQRRASSPVYSQAPARSVGLRASNPEQAPVATAAHPHFPKGEKQAPTNCDAPKTLPTLTSPSQLQTQAGAASTPPVNEGSSDRNPKNGVGQGAPSENAAPIQPESCPPPDNSAVDEKDGAKVERPDKVKEVKDVPARSQEQTPRPGKKVVPVEPAQQQKKPVIVITARVHAGEVPASHVCQGMLAFLLSTDPRATRLLRWYDVFVVPMLNADGVTRGFSRADGNGVNLNRVYDNPDRDEHPTVWALLQVLDRIAYQEPGGSLGGDEAALGNENVVMGNDGVKPAPPSSDSIKGAPSLGKGGFPGEGPPRVAAYLDLHAHARKKGIFAYGNSLSGQAAEEQALFAFLVGLRCPLFDYHGSNFSDCDFLSQGRVGTSRVVVGRRYNVPVALTIEAHYSGGCTTTFPGGKPNRCAAMPFVPTAFHGVGAQILTAFLDLHRDDDAARQPLPFYGNIMRARRYIIAAPRPGSIGVSKKEQRKKPTAFDD
ncbi:Cytosolic carboxypeptidase 6 [Diplonema papillatum]|nr:Cytosolic carboxypeptidase 6 [Diplonema papillatum]